MEDKTEIMEDKTNIMEGKGDKMEDKTDQMKDKADQMKDKTEIMEDEADQIEDEADQMEDEADQMEDKTEIMEDKIEIMEDKTNIMEGKGDQMEDKADQMEDKTDIMKDKTDIMEDKTDIMKDKADQMKDKTDIMEDKADKMEDMAEPQKDNKKDCPKYEDTSGFSENRQKIRRLFVECDQARQQALASIIRGEEVMHELRNDGYRVYQIEASPIACSQTRTLIGHLERILLETQKKRKRLAAAVAAAAGDDETEWEEDFETKEDWVVKRCENETQLIQDQENTADSGLMCLDGDIVCESSQHTNGKQKTIEVEEHQEELDIDQKVKIIDF